jgi:hypothetical protein
VVTTLVCYLHFAHEAAGAAGTRHSPRPLFSWANGSCKTRAHRAAGTRTRVGVIARSDLSAEARRAKAEGGSDKAIHSPSFRGDAKHRTRNLEIPGLVLTHHPGMMGWTAPDGIIVPDW